MSRVTYGTRVSLFFYLMINKYICIISLTSPMLMKPYRCAILCAVCESTSRLNRTRNELVKRLLVADSWKFSAIHVSKNSPERLYHGFCITKLRISPYISWVFYELQISIFITFASLKQCCDVEHKKSISLDSFTKKSGFSASYTQHTTEKNMFASNLSLLHYVSFFSQLQCVVLHFSNGLVGLIWCRFTSLLHYAREKCGKLKNVVTAGWLAAAAALLLLWRIVCVSILVKPSNGT